MKTFSEMSLFDVLTKSRTSYEKHQSELTFNLEKKVSRTFCRVDNELRCSAVFL